MNIEFLSAAESLTIGVTGRRFIVPEALERVEASARAFLRRISENWTKTGPIFVLTGLAIGADQLAARLVLEEKARNPRSPLRLVAVLPMDAEEYSNDFSTAPGTNGLSELDEFRRFLAASDYIFAVPPTSDDLERARRAEKFDRVGRYAALGEFLVERSQILLAFWSGNAAEVKRGGTADVVLRKARRDAERRELVYCVSTPEILRRKNPDGTKTRVPEPIENAGKVAILTPPTSEPPVFVAAERAEERFARFWEDEFNF